ncbi:MAG TPA: hypothetical protein VK177_03585 [Flavobacteriales bacterium]|nr:hypothetical protein [Flavobacteriales bacterium]
MKLIFASVFIFFVCGFANAQQGLQIDTTKFNSTTLFIVVKNDGTEFIGTILKMDAREILMNSTSLGMVYIPKHDVRTIKEIKPGEFKNGVYFSEEVFATRYFITTNGLPIQKNENYVQWNLFGPDFQFGVTKNLGVGILTSWVGIPIIANAKYSIPLSDKLHLGVGALVGTGSWAFVKAGIALPFASLTFGTRRSNINIAYGYGQIWNEKGTGSGRSLISIAALKKITQKISLVFDSFIVPPGTDYFVSTTNGGVISNHRPGLSLICPGFRWHTGVNRAMQFGFMGIVFDKKSIPVPLPMIQWFRKF